MTDNERLARWQGIQLTIKWGGGYPDIAPKTEWPRYINDDVAAMSLLDTLVEKDFMYELEGWTLNSDPVHTMRIYGRGTDSNFQEYREHANTRRAAVVAAVLELIGKEE